MKRFDLEICDGESGRCRAELREAADGDWILFDEAIAEINRLRAEIVTEPTAAEQLDESASSESSSEGRSND